MKTDSDEFIGSDCHEYCFSFWQKKQHNPKIMLLRSRINKVNPNREAQLSVHKNKKMNSIKTYGIGLFAMLMLFSCSDEILENQDANYKILHFETEEQMKQALSKVLKMTTEEKQNWASINGFNSYGVQADLFYDKIDPERFKSESEIIQFVNNSKYLKITTDENDEKSVEIISGDNRFRYFINNDMIFTVGDKAVKLIGKSTVSTCIDNLSELKLIEDIAQIEYNSDYSVKSPNTFYLKSVAACPLDTGWEEDEDGRYRLQVRAYAEEDYSSSEHSVAVGYKIRSQKRTIFWFAYQTTITYSIDLRAYHNYKTFSGSILPTSTYIVDSGSKYDNSVEDENSWVISWPNEIDANLRWGWYDVDASENDNDLSYHLVCGK